jgi:hypothetical protein
MKSTRVGGRGTAVVLAATACALIAPGVAGAATSGRAGRGPQAAKRQKLPKGLDLRNAGRCEFIAGGDCLMPFPNDRFTVKDRRTATGLRIHFTRASMPANNLGTKIDPAEWNRNDGFSPGQQIVVKVPGMDTPRAFARTRAVPLTDMAQTYRKDQPVLLLDAKTGRRQLIWAELDVEARTAKDRALLIHPGKNLEEGHRYVVALRGMRNAAGRVLQAPPGFRLYRDAIRTRKRPVEQRRAQFESIFKTLRKAGVRRGDLYLAWDFTVASRRALTSRMLKIRDDAFAQLGDADLADLKVEGSAPRYAITRTTDFTEAENPLIARTVEGTVEVPCYLDRQGCPTGSGFHYDSKDPDALPTQIAGNTIQAQFLCIVPRASGIAGGPVAPARPSLYGHGLLGKMTEVTAANVQAMAQEHDFVFCATPEIGFANEDVVTAAAILNDFSKFRTFVDRIQQGLLNELYLGRLMVHPQGLAADPAFQVGGQSVIDTTRLFYDGNSQGGILGGALTAFAPDFDRAVLGVPGMNYSVLLPRSTDWGTFSPLFNGSYANELQRPLVLSVAQMLWDRSEANGVAHHITDDPLPNTPRHEVLMHVALGDFQVSDTMAQVEARTIGAKVRTPVVAAGRSRDKQPFYAIGRIGGYPYDGSAIVLWDAGPIRDNGALGNNPAPIGNISPVEADAARGIVGDGHDPHGIPRATPAARAQKSEFLRVGGKVVDTCGAGTPCWSGSWTGG